MNNPGERISRKNRLRLLFGCYRIRTLGVGGFRLCKPCFDAYTRRFLAPETRTLHTGSEQHCG